MSLFQCQLLSYAWKVQFWKYILFRKIIFRYFNFNNNVLSAENNWVWRASPVLRTRLKTKQIWYLQQKEITMKFVPTPCSELKFIATAATGSRQSCKNFVSCVNFSRTKLMIMMHLHCFIAGKNSHHFQYVKFFCPKIGSCNFFSHKFQVCPCFPVINFSWAYSNQLLPTGFWKLGINFKFQTFF